MRERGGNSWRTREREREREKEWGNNKTLKIFKFQIIGESFTLST